MSMCCNLQRIISSIVSQPMKFSIYIQSQRKASGNTDDSPAEYAEEEEPESDPTARVSSHGMSD